MSLTDRVINGLKPSDKLIKRNDQDGLNLVVHPTGRKVWWLQYRFQGKQKTLVLGPYPAIGLADARMRAAAAKARLIDGIDPAAEKQRLRHNLPTEDQSSFREIVDEWFSKRKAKFSEKHAANVWGRVERIILPAIGALRLKEITTQHLYDLLKPIEARGAYETAHRVFQTIGATMRYAIKIGKCERDITADMRGMLEPRNEKHHPTITEPLKVGQLLRVIDGYDGYFITKCALKMAPLVFVRPGELRAARWDEFALDNSEWRIPAKRIKMKDIHIIPLARQTIQILRELREASGHCEFLFPSVRSAQRIISDNTVNAALRRLGYAQDELTGHGFRSMASTLLNQMGWDKDWIERQLAHSERNSVRAAYNFADFLPQRQIMMQAWADYLDQLRENTSSVAPAPRTLGPHAQLYVTT